ncbi:MAG TPA: efflux RND transporter periplasmic adaptor subunit [Rhizomicrobium sp.]|jgi:multidrug efflux system membrane fusion protein|nr:efflux RND transporter periplasmic adaptor subunit [Rhizomicrobium sp.]
MFETLKTFFQSAGHTLAGLQPPFFRRMKASYRAATVILVIVVLWIASGVGHHATIAVQAKTSDVPSVQVMALTASKRDATLTIRGRTEALHAVDVRAEVDGMVKAIHFDKGDTVKEGDVLCELKINDKGARFDESRALVSQREKEYSAARNLAAKGYVSETQAKQAAAALEAAQADLRTQQIALSNINIRAPFDGIVDDRYVNEGDYMRTGDKCEMVVAPQPFLAVGTVSEHDVGGLKVGDPATAVLVTGQTVEGKIRFIAERADTATRTFRLEVELPNPDAKLRDGVSADIKIPVKQVMAQKISSGILVLDDNGVYGVRIVDDRNIVHFMPVQIVSDDPDGMWVSGLPDKVTVITVGQQFVSDGSHVKAVQSGARG